MSKLGMAQVRAAIKGFCPEAGYRVTHDQLYEVFGLVTGKEKSRVRRNCQALVGRRELTRVEPGVYIYNPDAVEPDQVESYQRIWRAVRVRLPGWTSFDIVQVTRVSVDMVRRYCRFLAEEGYIAPHGKRGNTKLWRATPKAKAHRETPYPPRALPDPYAPEKTAACRLVRCLMETDPGKPRVREKIITECQRILSRRKEALAMLVSEKITQQATALKGLLQPGMTQEDVAVANIQFNGILAEAEVAIPWAFQE